MSTAINGIDLVLEVPKAQFALPSILDIVYDFWPEAIFQAADAEHGVPLAHLLDKGKPLSVEEFFLYRDEQSQRTWDEHGWTESNANTMIHFLLAEKQADQVEVTMVVDSLTPEIASLYLDLNRELQQPRDAEPTKPRATVETTLQKFGCQLPRHEFYSQVEEVRVSLFSRWTQDELVCHPHDAMKFCASVRACLNANLPDDLILKAVLNARKRRMAKTK